jgi:hypothetical protein
MKNIFSAAAAAVALLCALVVVSSEANTYQGIRYETTTGKVYEHMSGELSIAASTATWSTYTITMNGTGGVVTAQKVVVSTASALSSDSLCFAGAHAALPTTGYARGCLLYLTTDPTNIYLSTETVVGVQSWLAK